MENLRGKNEKYMNTINTISLKDDRTGRIYAMQLHDESKRDYGMGLGVAKCCIIIKLVIELEI